MGRKYRFTFEQKLEAVTEHLINGISMSVITKKLQCYESNIRRWIARYKTFGVDGLKHNIKKLKYSKELKLDAVQEYISGTRSLIDICIKYKIKNVIQLQNWISLYNNDKILKPRGYNTMKIKGIRKNLTLEDRVEIVKHYIRNKQ